MNIVHIAQQLKDEDADKILSHPEDFPQRWVELAKGRRGNKKND
jgi:hypothetical protein